MYNPCKALTAQDNSAAMGGLFPLQETLIFIKP